MTCESPCSNCNRTGLPILFTRYAAAYSVQEKGMAALRQLRPMGQLQAQPGGVTMKTAQYNVRMLRAGYLYLLIEVAGEKRWEGYAVHPHGYLTAFPVSAPEAAKVHIACARDDRPANASMVWVKDAKRVKKLWYMFHPDAVDYDHLKQKIEPNLDEYMQSFDVAGWVNGKTSQTDTCQPGQLNEQVVEFSALSTPTVRDAIEPQMYGLMGSNPQERGWGDYEEEVKTPQYTAMGDVTGGEDTSMVKRSGPTYEVAHGARLKKMADFLQDQKGAVIACEDAIGICQELGHLQAEAQMVYAHWQASGALGHHKDVSNEWVLQAAIGVQGLIDLAEKGAVARVDKGFEESGRIRAPLPHDPQEAAQERARRDAARTVNYQRELLNAKTAVQSACDQLLDRAAARDILQEQKVRQEQAQKNVAALGSDQNAWLRASGLRDAMARFSAQDTKINRPGGGAALSLQAAQCLAGTEAHEAGREVLKEMEFSGDNLLSRMLSFNSETLKATHKAIEDAKRPAESTPTPDPETQLADSLANALKLTAGRLALGDKALGFIEEAGKGDAPAALRKFAWAGNVFSLLSARALTGINALPKSALEARLVQHLALAGMSTMGSTVQKETARLKVDVAENAKRIALRAKKLQGAADPGTRAGRAAALERARSAAPGTRAAMLGGLFDMSSAIIKGSQFGTKLDLRSGFDLIGQTLQGIGSLYDWRAKAYEETLFKGVKGTDLYKYKALSEGLDAMKAAHLKSLRLTAFRFLGPAAVFSVVLDAIDAGTSRDRGQKWLSRAQAASALGTTFTILGTGAAIIGVESAAWAAAAATLGLVGAVLAIGAAIFILLLSEDKWITWMRDIPLNKERKGQKPIHKDLQETLQELINAQSALQST